MWCDLNSLSICLATDKGESLSTGGPSPLVNGDGSIPAYQQHSSIWTRLDRGALAIKRIEK